ncbi:MAG: hypothetical protein AAB215_01140, partial [Planctomycetota bacterium]
MAAIQIRGLLLADRKTGALGEDVWGRFGEALLAPGTPEGLRDNALENFRHFPNREGCAQAGRNLLGAKDASARRIGALLAMTAFFRSTSDEESRRLFDAFAAEPALAEAAAAARNFPQLLRRIPDDALAPKAAAFLDMARPMPAAVAAIAERGAAPGAVRSVLSKPPEKAGGKPRTDEEKAAWLAAASLAGIPEAATEAAALLRTPASPAAKRLVELLQDERASTAGLPAPLASVLLAIASDVGQDANARRWALGALARIDGLPDVSSLGGVAASEGTPLEIRAAALRLLAQASPAKAADAAARMAKSSDARARAIAADILVDLGTPEAVLALESLAKEGAIDEAASLFDRLVSDPEMRPVLRAAFRLAELFQRISPEALAARIPSILDDPEATGALVAAVAQAAMAPGPVRTAGERHEPPKDAAARAGEAA